MIVFKMLDDGAFVAGDTETQRTSYAYPTSPHATEAKRKPIDVAHEMMKNENCSTRDRSAPIFLYDQRNWARLA